MIDVLVIDALLLYQYAKRTTDTIKKKPIWYPIIPKNREVVVDRGDADDDDNDTCTGPGCH